MDHDLFIRVLSFPHDTVENCFLSDSAPTHSVQKRPSHNVPCDMVSETLYFLRGRAQEVVLISVSVVERKDLKKQRQKNGELLPHFVPLAQLHTT